MDENATKETNNKAGSELPVESLSDSLAEGRFAISSPSVSSNDSWTKERYRFHSHYHLADRCWICFQNHRCFRPTLRMRTLIQ